MEFLEKLKASIKDFTEENTKLVIAISVVLSISLLGAVIAVAFQEPLPKKKKKADIKPPKPYSAVQEFLPPKGSSLTEDYYFSREQNPKWSDEEFDKWFTVPSEKDAEELGEANENLINELLGEVP